MTRAKKTYRMGFLIDPIECMLPDKDTTFVMMLEAQKRGHQVLYFTREDLYIEHGRPRSMMHQVELARPNKKTDSHFRLISSAEQELGDLDIVFMRKDPPFTIDYVYLTHFLDMVPSRTVVANRPSGLRSANEKLYSQHFPQAIPKSLVTRDIERLKAFTEELGKIVVKPLDAMGGLKIFVVDQKDRNRNVILETVTDQGREWILAQEYLPASRKGDKRIIMLSGEPIGATLRVPDAADHRGNIHVGGTCVKTTLTPRDRELCSMVGPWLRREGLHLVGLDVIGKYITEINVTSPTGVQEINRLDGVCLENRIMDFMEWLIQGTQNQT